MLSTTYYTTLLICSTSNFYLAAYHLPTTPYTLELDLIFAFCAVLSITSLRFTCNIIQKWTLCIYSLGTCASKLETLVLRRCIAIATAERASATVKGRILAERCRVWFWSFFHYPCDVCFADNVESFHEPVKASRQTRLLTRWQGISRFCYACLEAAFVHIVH